MLKRLILATLGLIALVTAALPWTHGTARQYAYIGGFNQGFFLVTGDGNLHIVGTNDLQTYVNLPGYVQYVPHDCCGNGSTAMCGAPNIMFNPNDGALYVACSIGVDTNWTATTMEIARSTDVGKTWSYVTTITADLASVCTGGHPESWVESWFVDSDNSIHLGWLCCPNSTTVPLFCSEWGLDATVRTNFTPTSWSASTQLAGTGLPSQPLNEHITKVGSTYYLFIKDDAPSGPTSKEILVFSSSSLWTGYTAVTCACSATWGAPRESPYTLQTLAGQWTMGLDPEGTGELVSFMTAGSFPNGTWTTPVAVTAPFQMQHGNVIQTP